MKGKLALRTVQNADIVLEGCRVPENERLAGANSFKDTGPGAAADPWRRRVELRLPHDGADEAAVAYAASPEQLCGSPSCRGPAPAPTPALAKASCASRMRETVAYAQEVLGSNGIWLDHGVVRSFNDAEAQ